jgi:4'-phosphopantetheinyl transferase EntD
VTALLPTLLDARVLSAEGCPTKLGQTATLLPEEERAIARAVASRRAQYAATRALARGLLRDLGWPDAALLNRRDRSPIWPSGVVGSITQ